MCKKDILEVDRIEDLEHYIPSKYKKRCNKLFSKADESYKKILKYIEGNIEEKNKDELIELLEEYYIKCDEFYIYNEKCHFIAGKADGIKYMAAIYNLDTSE